VLWSEVSLGKLDESLCENPKMTRKEQLNDRKAAHYIGKTRIKVVTNEGDQPLALTDWRIEYTLDRNATPLISKSVGMRDQV